MESSSSSNLENVMNRFSDHTYRNWYNRSGLSSNLEKENGNPLQYSFFFFFSHSSILAWRIPWTEEPERLSPWGHKSWTRLSKARIIFLQRDSPSYLDDQPGLRTQKVPCRQNHLILNLYPNTGGGWPCSQGPLLWGLNLDHSLKRPLELWFWPVGHPDHHST